jgi:hypothetical protein
MTLFFADDPDLQLYQFSFVSSRQTCSKDIEVVKEKDITIEEALKLDFGASAVLDVPRLSITVNLEEQRQAPAKNGREHVESKLRSWASKSKALMRLLKPQSVDGMMLTPQVLLAALNGKSTAGGLGLTAEELHMMVEYMARTAKQRASDMFSVPAAQRERVPETMEEIEAAVSELRWWERVPQLSRLRLLPLLDADELANEMLTSKRVGFQDGLRSRLRSQAALADLPSMISTGATLANTRGTKGSYSGNGHQEANQWLRTACEAWSRKQFGVVRVALSRAEASYADAGEAKQSAAARCLRDLLMADEAIESVVPEALAEGRYGHAVRVIRSAGMALLRYSHHPKHVAAQLLLSVAQSQVDATQEVYPDEGAKHSLRYQRKDSYLPQMGAGGGGGRGALLQSASAPALPSISGSATSSPSKPSCAISAISCTGSGTVAGTIGGGGWSQQSLVAQQQHEKELQAKVEIDEARAVARVGVSAAERGLECFMLAKSACGTKRRQFAEAKAMLAQAQSAFGWLEQQDERTKGMVEMMRRERRNQQSPSKQSLPLHNIPTAEQLGALAWRVHESQARSVAETLRFTLRSACGEGGVLTSHNSAMTAEQTAAEAVWGVYRWLAPVSNARAIAATIAPASPAGQSGSDSAPQDRAADIYCTLPVMAMFTLDTSGSSGTRNMNATAEAAAAAAAADGAYGGKEHTLLIGPSKAQLRELLLPSPSSNSETSDEADAPASSPTKRGEASDGAVEIIREACCWVTTRGGSKGVRTAVYALLELLTRLQLSQAAPATPPTDAPTAAAPGSKREQKGRRRAQRAEQRAQRAQEKDGMAKAEAVAVALVRQGAVQAAVSAVAALVEQGGKQKAIDEVRRDRDIDRDRRQGRKVKPRAPGRKMGWAEEELCRWLRMLAFLVRCGGKKGATLAAQHGAVKVVVGARELYPLLEPPTGVGLAAPDHEVERTNFVATRELSACVLQVMVALASSSGGTRLEEADAQSAGSERGGAAVVVVIQELIEGRGVATAMSLLGRHAASAPEIAVGCSWFVRQFLPPLMYQTRAADAEARHDVVPGRESKAASGLVEKRLMASAEALLMKGATLPFMQAIRSHAARALEDAAEAAEAAVAAVVATAASTEQVETAQTPADGSRSAVRFENAARAVGSAEAAAVEAATRALLALAVAYPTAVKSQVLASGLCECIAAQPAAATSVAAASAEPTNEGGTNEKGTDESEEQDDTWVAALDLPSWDRARGALLELRGAIAPKPRQRKTAIEFTTYVHHQYSAPR